MVKEFFGSGLFPGLSVELVKDHKLVYARALGVADKGTGRPATIETIYELGSVGKVLTSTVLAILDDRGVVRIDDPVRKSVPAIADIPEHPDGGSPITLEHLATNASGLPGVPANVDHLPPYQWKGYSPELLREGFKQTELRAPAGEQSRVFDFSEWDCWATSWMKYIRGTSSPFCTVYLPAAACSSAPRSSSHSSSSLGS